MVFPTKKDWQVYPLKRTVSKSVTFNFAINKFCSKPPPPSYGHTYTQRHEHKTGKHQIICFLRMVDNLNNLFFRLLASSKGSYEARNEYKQNRNKRYGIQSTKMT